MEGRQAGLGGLDETISTLREGVGRLTLKARLDRIGGWWWRLGASGVPELEPIADGLTRLEDRLGGDDVDPFTAGNVMVDLGGRVRDLAATDAGRDFSDRLEALADLLERQGQRLADAQR